MEIGSQLHTKPVLRFVCLVWLRGHYFQLNVDLSEWSQICIREIQKRENKKYYPKTIDDIIILECFLHGIDI